MPTEPKPLMIRGDRLLLALEVLGAWVHPHPSVELRFSRDRIAEIVRRYIPDRFSNRSDLQEPDYQKQFRERFEADIASLLRFLAASEETVNATMFMADELIAMLQEHVPHHAAQAFQRFLSAIASGELTEGDFKKRSAP